MPCKRQGKQIELFFSALIYEFSPVVVTGEQVSKLLSVHKTESGSGEAQAKAVYESLEKWGITNMTQLRRTPVSTKEWQLY
jgi:ABC-type microcin C transport system duplicated ATPase subunit YejF